MTAAGALALWWGLERPLLEPALLGLALAWTVSTVGFAALAFSMLVSFRAFAWAFGGGVASRLSALAVMMTAVWNEPGRTQGAAVVPYIVGVVTLVIVEHRHLKRVRI